LKIWVVLITKASKNYKTTRIAFLLSLLIISSILWVVLLTKTSENYKTTRIAFLLILLIISSILWVVLLTRASKIYKTTCIAFLLSLLMINSSVGLCDHWKLIVFAIIMCFYLIWFYPKSPLRSHAENYLLITVGVGRCCGHVTHFLQVRLLGLESSNKFGIVCVGRSSPIL